MLHYKAQYKGWVFNSYGIHFPQWVTDTVKVSTSKPSLVSTYKAWPAFPSHVVSQITPCLINMPESQQSHGTHKPLQDYKTLRENKVLLLYCGKDALLKILNIYKNLLQFASQTGVWASLDGCSNVQAWERWNKRPWHSLVEPHLTMNNMKLSFER